MWFRVKEIVSESFRWFRTAPILFLLFQIPEALVEGVEDIAGNWIEGKPFAALALLIPAYCLSSAIASALTCSAVIQLKEGKKPTLAQAFRRFSGRGLTLILAALAVGLAVALGIAAMFLPAIYFMAIYIFVPYIIADGEASTVGAALARSKRLVGKDVWKWCCLVAGLLAFGIATYFGGDLLVKSFNQINDSPSMHLLSYVIFKLGISLCLGAAIDLALANAYLKLKGRTT